jgi:DTW domain-containing protein YfiP
MIDAPAPEGCPRCGKPADLCVCGAFQRFDNRIEVLILQHPQEPDRELGTAELAHRALARSTLRVGLSWPNLKAALGRDADPRGFAVLYLGSGPRGPVPRGQPLLFLDRKGVPVAPAAASSPLEGLVVLDGTWSQAKTLWWRNAWLLKLRRVILSPPQPSLYRELRREPRRECLSTLESIALALTATGEPPAVAEGLRAMFARLLERERARHRAGRDRRP